jgi:hypothetical protein
VRLDQNIYPTLDFSTQVEPYSYLKDQGAMKSRQKMVQPAELPLVSVYKKPRVGAVVGKGKPEDLIHLAADTRCH